MKKSLATLGVLAAAALALSGCTDSAAPPAASPDASGDAEPMEMTTVRVAALPIAETGALWAAMEEGIFEDHGLEIEVVPAQGGANAIPALLSGDIQFAIGQPFGPIRADQQDLGVVIVGNYANSNAEGDDVNAVVALGDSGITRPADLAGKKVSVNTIGAAGDLTIRKAVQDDGGDPSSIEFVEVVFPDVPAQLEAGTMDAAWAPDPFRGIVLGAGGVSVVQPYQATIPGLTVLTSITTQALLDEDPDLVAAYAAAMAEALDWAAEQRRGRARGDRDQPRDPRGGGGRHHAAHLHVGPRRRRHRRSGCPRRRVRLHRGGARLRHDDPAAVTYSGEGRMPRPAASGPLIAFGREPCTPTSRRHPRGRGRAAQTATDAGRFRRGRRTRSARKIALGVAGIIGFLVTWQLLPTLGLVDPRYFPTATETLAQLGQDVRDLEFWRNVGRTLTAGRSAC